MARFCIFRSHFWGNLRGRPGMLRNLLVLLCLSIYLVPHLPSWALFVFYRLQFGSGDCSALPLNMDPWSPSVKKYTVKLPDYVDCKMNEKRFFTVDKVGHLQPVVNLRKSMRCFYSAIKNQTDSDVDIEFTEETLLDRSINLVEKGINFVRVRCFNGTVFTHEEAHSFASTVRPRSVQADQPSVAIFVIESLSRMSYLRFMPQTKRSFESLGNYFYFKGLTKVADNSFPNMLTLLTGISPAFELLSVLSKERNGPFDDHPFVWKKFKNHTTALVEEFARFALFNFYRKGFRRQPTDWYPRPFWLYVDKTNPNAFDNMCYKNRAQVDIFLDQCKQFIERANPFFLYAFYIKPTHFEFNNAQLLDSHYARFIAEQRAILEDSVVILMGDHGNRFGPVLETAQGRIEERMPLFALHIPTKLVQKYPHIKNYLEINENRLTTWIDVHRFLNDLAESKFEPITTTEKKTNYSIMREEIPLDRTCDDALIGVNYCVCSLKVETSPDTTFARGAAAELVKEINRILFKAKQCKPLTLVKIKSAFRSRIKEGIGPVDLLEVVIETAPSHGIFSANMQQADSTEKWKLVGDISRLNMYGDESWCVTDTFLKKLCYC